MASVGQTVIHSPHPIQSNGDTLMVNLYSLAFGLVSATFMLSGAALISSSLTRNGRIVAWEHTNAHWLHWIHFSASHSGTVTAVPRFSYAEAPSSNWPSAISLNADTGRLSPSISPIGFMSSSTIFTVPGRPSSFGAGASASGLDQEAGISTL